MIIDWITVPVREVVTINVVNVAVAIIVDAVTWNLAWVCPHIVSKIFVIVVDT